MEEKVNIVESLFERTKEYSRSSLELVKLKVIAKSAELISAMASRLIVLVAGILFLLVFTVAIALWIGDLLGKAYYGFLIVSAFYAIVGLVAHYFMKDRIRKHISDSFVKQFFN